MKQCPKALCFVAAMLFAGILGCGGQKVNYDKTITVGLGEVQSILIEAPKGEQKLTVDIKATGSPVDVYVALDENQDAIKQALLASKTPDAAKLLVSKKGVESDTLETKIPAGKAFGVTLAGAKKKAEVKVKIKGT